VNKYARYRTVRWEGGRPVSEVVGTSETHMMVECVAPDGSWLRLTYDEREKCFNVTTESAMVIQPNVSNDISIRVRR
jgi:hypothetical protein